MTYIVIPFLVLYQLELDNPSYCTIAIGVRFSSNRFIIAQLQSPFSFLS